MKKRFVVPFVLLLVFSAARADSPTEVAGATTVDVATAKTLFDRGITFVDVRGRSPYLSGHIPGAVNFTDELIPSSAETAFSKIVNKDQEVVIYCGGPTCNLSADACAAAVEWGYEKVYYFRDGYPGWEAAGYAVEK